MNYNTHAIDRLIGEVFRLYGAIVAAGDAVTKPFGLSSSRWQIMGAIEATGGATVSDLARLVGVTRQSVQRIVTEMIVEEYCALRENPRHQRARIVVMSDTGWQAYNAVTAAWKSTAERMDTHFGSNNLAGITQKLVDLRNDFRGSVDPANRSSNTTDGEIT